MKTEESLINVSFKTKALDIFDTLKLPVLAIIAGMACGCVIIATSGFNPFAAILGLLKGGYGSTYLFFTTLTRATPIIIAGLAAAFTWGAGYESMGVGGQMTMGAFVSSVVAVSCPGSSVFVIIVSLTAGALAGAAFSLIPTWMSQKFQVSLLIVTLMMNYIADYITSYFTTYIVKDPYGSDSSAIQTAEITAVFPKFIERYSLHYGFLIAVVCVILLYFIMYRTTFGYKAHMGGLNPRFADYGGINSKKMMYYVLNISGALAGLAGAIEVIGAKHRFIDQMITSPGYAWSGITASIMSNYNPIGTFVSSVFLAGLTTGGSYIERNMGVPGDVSTVIQSVITMLATIKIAIQISKRKKEKHLRKEEK